MRFVFNLAAVMVRFCEKDFKENAYKKQQRNKLDSTKIKLGNDI
jgi:hypothetical protein